MARHTVDTATPALLSHEEEIALAVRAGGGDREAWGTLYARFVKPVKGYIAGRVGSLDDADDLAQECFIRAQSRLEGRRYDAQYRFYTLLRGIAEHVVRDHWACRHVRDEDIGEQASDGCDTTGGAPREDSLDRLELFRLMLTSDAKPHQCLVFGLITLLEWRPREVVAERRTRTLGEIAEEFCRGYHEAISPFLTWQTFRREYCAPLFGRLESPLADVYVEHEYEDLRRTHRGKVKFLPLEVFFGSDPSASLSDWCHRVRERTRKLLLVESIR